MRAIAFLPLLVLAGCAGRPAPEQPRSYRYTCDYFIHDAAGNFRSKMRVQAVHTRGLPEGIMRWSRSGISFATTQEGEYSLPARQEYMDGLSYPDTTSIEELLAPDLYAGFPSTPLAFVMKMSVLDVHMFDAFLADLDRLKPNETKAFSGAHTEDIPLFGNEGKQTLRRLDLTWIGDTLRNGKPCSVIAYRSDVGPVAMTLPGFDQLASTVFWGEIWVSQKDRQVEHATIYEHTLTVPPDPEARVKSLQNVYRTATLERLETPTPRRD